MNAPNNPIGIIGAMPQEVKTLTEYLTDKKTTAIAGMMLYSGSINGVSVVVMQSGIGKVNATIATTLLIERFSPKAIINTGSAGGIGQGLSVGDVVIGNSVAHHDVDVTAFGYQMGQMAQMPADYVSDKHLLSVAEQASHHFTDATVHKGLIVSGDQFIADSERFSIIKKHFPNALSVEMEASAIAQTCYRFEIPFVVIRAISDLANAKASISFDEFIEHAGKQSAEMIMAMLPKI
ncbi:MAG: 5'-methylthioadenosine/S-adenosylhomocysteine nucleosidase [Gammaproteobacteria bacterium]|nr:MAG: 5'-methylthioadenosine/S-adenosylhomocysteine nucleosidase [Gammaproteobacteria bacterium]